MCEEPVVIQHRYRDGEGWTEWQDSHFALSSAWGGAVKVLLTSKSYAITASGLTVKWPSGGRTQYRVKR